SDMTASRIRSTSAPSGRGAPHVTEWYRYPGGVCEKPHHDPGPNGHWAERLIGGGRTGYARRSRTGQPAGYRASTMVGPGPESVRVSACPRPGTPRSGGAMSRRPRSLLRILLSVALGVPVVALGVLGGPATPASALPAGFNEEIVFAGLTQPTKLVFSPDGRVFVGQKNGLIKVYDSVSDPTPDIFADLRTNVFDYDDSGLLGLAVPPDFPANPWVYVSYTYDGLIGG